MNSAVVQTGLNDVTAAKAENPTVADAIGAALIVVGAALVQLEQELRELNQEKYSDYARTAALACKTIGGLVKSID